MSQSAHDNQFFLDAMQGVKPLSNNDKIYSPNAGVTLAQQLKREAIERQQQQNRNYLSVEKVSPVDPYDMLSFKKDGVQEGVFKKLRLGQYPMETTLDLRQHKFEQARSALFDNLLKCHERGTRALLIRHGIGLESKPFPAFLKSYVNQWLMQMPEVIAFHSAQKHHGGLASTYVLLKKNAQQKLENREKHRKP